MTGYELNGLGSGGSGGGGAAARTAPAIPGLEQGNPATTARPAQAPAAPSQPGVAVNPIGPNGRPRTADEIRTDIQNQIRNGIRNGNGGDPQIIIPPDFNFRNAVPQGAVDISIAFFVTLAVIIVGLPLARALGRRMDTANQERLSGAKTIAPQLQQLQETVDAMAIEIERISEGQRFQSKLLAGREKEAEPAKLVR